MEDKKVSEVQRLINEGILSEYQFSDLNFYIIQNGIIMESEKVEAISGISGEKYAETASGIKLFDNMYKIYCFEFNGFNVISMNGVGKEEIISSWNNKLKSMLI